MTGIEERLREDLREFTQRAQPGAIRPLRAPAPRRRARTARWLAPVAAATAVVAVVAGVTLVSRMSNRPATGAPAGMPPYYVVVTQTANLDDHSMFTETADVYDSATGHLLDRVPVPVGTDFSAGGSISAAANDRLFAIGSTGGESIYLLRLAADGHSEGLQKLPVKDGAAGITPELSPDGSHLAYLTMNCSIGCVFGIGVVPVARPSAVKIWQQGKGASPQALSWAGDNSQVMFGSQSNPPVKGLKYRLLNITGPGGNLLTDSRPIPFPAGMSAESGQQVFLTSGGGIAVGAIEQNDPGRDTVTGSIVVLSRSTGRQRVLYVGTEHYPSKQGVPSGLPQDSCYVQSLGANGVQPLIYCYHRFGRIVGGKFTPLPGESGGPTNGAIWDAAW